MTRLTLALPEDLSRRAKARAALEGTTLSAVIRTYLQDFAAGLDEAQEELEDIRAVLEIQRRIEAGTEQFYDWEEVKAELDALPSEDRRDSKGGNARSPRPRPPARSTTRRSAGR